MKAPAAGDVLTVTVADCWLGGLVVASSSAGLVSVLLGEDSVALQGELRRRFPSANLVPVASGADRQAKGLLGFLAEPGQPCELPLDIRGTVFQKRVWAALRQIPAGSTATYSEIARKIGAPAAVRAVAGACAANHLAVAIPCHRVVGSNGSLTGYRWGVALKRALLEREGVLARSSDSARSSIAQRI